MATAAALVPLAAGEAIEHTGALYGSFMISLSILFIIITVIVIAAAKTQRAKTAGWVLLAFSAMLGGYGMYMTSRRKKTA